MNFTVISIKQKAEQMRSRFNKIHGQLKGLHFRITSDTTQMVKRFMYRFGMVPPPFRISIDITDQCNLHCPTCAKWRTKKNTAQELNLKDWAAIFTKIKGIPLLKEIAISGGEPFTRPDILDILNLAKQSRLSIVVVSNGQNLDESMLQQLSDLGVDNLMLSLNSLKENVHDQSRGMPGNYAQLMKLINTWQNQIGDMRLTLSTIIMQSNYNELVDMAEFVHSKGLSGIMFQVLLPVETHYILSESASMPQIDKEWYETNPDWIQDFDKLLNEMRILHKLQRRGVAILNPSSQLKHMVDYFQFPENIADTPCIGTQNRIYIDPVGDMRLCYGFPLIGNVLKDDPKKVWRSQAARDIRYQSRSCMKPCRMQNCNL